MSKANEIVLKGSFIELTAWIFVLISAFFINWIRALCIRDLWNWFIQTGFGLQSISVVSAFGAAFILRLILLNKAHEKTMKLGEAWTEILHKIVAILLFWGSGRIVFEIWVRK